MKKIYITSLVLLIFVTGLGAQDKKPAKSEITPGNWLYGVYLGKTKIGSANVVIRIDEGIIVTTTEMSLNMGEVLVTTKEISKENIDYTPVSFWSSNVMVLKDKLTREIVSATFNKGVVTLTRGKDERIINIEGSFVVSGNKLTSILSKAKYAKDFEAKVKLYDPTIDEDSTVTITDKVIGKEMVDLPGGKMELIHTVQAIGPLRNIHNYVNADGTAYKMTIPMLNTSIDMILERKPADK
jgi:hypothetical protein